MTVANLTRAWTLLAVALVLVAQEAGAERLVLASAKLVWTQGARAYIASADSLPLQPGSLLEFRYRREVVATGEVEAVYEDQLVAAMVSGSFRKVKHLEQVEITALPFRPPSRIRVGYPAAGRTCLLFNFTHLTPDTTLLGGAFRPESLAVSLFRFVRTSEPPVAAAWPDTLWIRLYSEATDEEIALERGDIDVAVFWPGEASAHIRDAMGWTGPPYGWRSGLLLAATAQRPLGSGLFADENRALDRLNKDVFDGDLVTLSRDSQGISDAPEPRGRFEVAAEIPGKEVMERVLRDAMGDRPTNRWDGTVRLEIRPVAKTELTPYRQGCWIGLGCPAISSQRSRQYVARLDANALANLFLCTPSQAKP